MVDHHSFPSSVYFSCSVCVGLSLLLKDKSTEAEQVYFFRVGVGEAQSGRTPASSGGSIKITGLDKRVRKSKRQVYLRRLEVDEYVH